jgi:hypothetical protein
MNIKQILILLGGAAVTTALVYLTASGEGVQRDEFWRLGVAGTALLGSVAGLVWAFRD